MSINTNKLLTLPAPAKLNLFLHITGRRADGYHELQTVFQLLDYSDEISLRSRDDGLITRHKDSDAEALNIPYESDLCVRAAKLIQKQLLSKTDSDSNSSSKSDFGAEIHLNKRLPIGGGIGGGSSNAATVLLGLNKLWNAGLSSDELADLGVQLGADVPVFVRANSAWAEGIGEQLTPLNLEEKWFVVIHPKLFVSTADIFADQALTRDCDTLRIARFLEDNQLDFMTDEFSNVFELIVTKKYPEIATVINWLSSYSLARLTGTGSCVFAAFDSKNNAIKVLEALTESSHNWSAFVAKGVNRSSLIDGLQEE